MEQGIARDELLRKAMRAFSLNGVKNLSQRKIMQEYGLSAAEFQAQFSNKEDFLRQALNLYLEEQRKVQLTLLAKSHHPISELLNVIKHHAAELLKITPAFFIQIEYLYPQVWQLYQRHIQMHTYHLFYELLNKGVQQRLFRQDLNLEVVTKVLLEQINVLLNRALFPPQRFNLAEVFRGIFLYYLKGISTEQGNKELENFFSDFALS
ncbi:MULTISPECIES: TetR/AcrR family transcriptional regulator [Rufibacter]|uniref:Trp operon repressor n=1 Tax=Rufibacter quisquiliarum TaxID=1549639 RepID=A0A839GLV1_9BACT|nr:MULTISPECIES: TetR family transcriptional regulator [Rufibacter]MBA9075917.1 Trp operon repressor [Rufibacter quisquiliarum]